MLNPQKAPAAQLVLLSFLLLFIELTLIRWAGSLLYTIAFFSNFILIASFLGIGLGFMRQKSSLRLFPLSPVLLAALVVLCYFARYEYILPPNANIADIPLTVPLFKNNVFPIYFSLPIIFIAVTITMATIADGVARVFQQFPALIAYRLDIAGSLLAIIVFSLLAFLHPAPIYWGVIICLLYLVLFIQETKKSIPSFLHLFIRALQILSLVIIMFAFTHATNTHTWSPYYKITVQKDDVNRYAVSVNGLPQQFIESVAQRQQYNPFYFFPYQHRTANLALKNVLVIGAGTGGDVAIALAHGAQHVDAVEIDPALYQLGKRLHPDQPYDNPRVQIHIQDGRAFLQQTTQQYDLVILALTDSMLILSGQSSLRLENYLFTLEAFAQIKTLLTADGTLAMYNYYQSRWLVDRLANMLDITFGHAPCLDTYGQQEHWLSVLTINKLPNNLQCTTPWSAADLVISPSTDDHPFLYIQSQHVSFFYAAMLIFILLTAMSASKISGISYSTIGKYLDLFLLGVAFLLLEAKSIVNFALFFGTTWLVNALVFIAILTMVYLAIEVTQRVTLRPKWLYASLLLALLLAWFIPAHYLLTLPGVLRFIAASLLTFMPIFIANLIFADRFRYTAHSTEAFGVNLLGAVCGGLLEYVSILIGYQNLLLVAAMLYALAILIMLKKHSPAIAA